MRINPGSFKIKCWALCFGTWQALFSLPLDLTSHHKPSLVCPVCAVDSKYVGLPSAHSTVCRFGASDIPRRLSSLLLLHAWFGVCWFHIRLRKWGVALGWPVREHCVPWPQQLVEPWACVPARVNETWGLLLGLLEMKEST